MTGNRSASRFPLEEFAGHPYRRSCLFLCVGDCVFFAKAAYQRTHLLKLISWAIGLHQHQDEIGARAKFPCAGSLGKSNQNVSASPLWVFARPFAASRAARAGSLS